MKTRIAVLTLLLAMASGALAVLFLPFPGWGRVEEVSEMVFIARCSTTPAQIIETNGMYLSYKDGLLVADVEVKYVLKGATNLGPARLCSLYWPRQGDYYLVFARKGEGMYNAIEEYRIVPLGTTFSLDSIVGNPMDEQIQILFKSRLWRLNRELEQGQEEKKRLEEGLRR